jgi:predicted transcriptional regulator
MKMFTIDEFMTSEPFTLRETDTVNDAWQVMTEKHIRHIPVTDNDNHLLGLVTQRDILAATGPANAPREANSNIKLSEIMIRDVSSIHQSGSLRRAAMYLQSHKYGCLPVMSDDRLVGIITDSDFIAIAINLLEQAELAEEEIGTIDDIMDDFNVELPEVEEDL